MNFTNKISVIAVAVSGLVVVGCGGSGDSGGARTLVYASGSIEGVKVMRTSGSGQKEVLGNTFGSPSMSQDGRIFEALFSVNNDEIWSMNQDGNDQVKLTNNAADDFRPCVTPDGSKIAFVSNRDGNDEIYVMNGDGTNQTRLTNNAAIDTSPAISADGTKIVFSSNRDGNTEIYSINVNGTGLTRLTNNAVTDQTPAWSPDGTKIIYSSSQGGNLEICRMDDDGDNFVKLTNTANVDESSPSFKLDGSAIFYSTTPDTGPNQVFRMNPDGSGQTNLCNNSADEFKTATWVY